MASESHTFMLPVSSAQVKMMIRAMARDQPGMELLGVLLALTENWRSPRRTSCAAYPLIHVLRFPEDRGRCVVTMSGVGSRVNRGVQLEFYNCTIDTRRCGSRE
jgi:hypothetical protein